MDTLVFTEQDVQQASAEILEYARSLRESIETADESKDAWFDDLEIVSQNYFKLHKIARSGPCFSCGLACMNAYQLGDRDDPCLECGCKLDEHRSCTTMGDSRDMKLVPHDQCRSCHECQEYVPRYSNKLYEHNESPIDVRCKCGHLHGQHVLGRKELARIVLHELTWTTDDTARAKRSQEYWHVPAFVWHSEDHAALSPFHKQLDQIKAHFQLDPESDLSAIIHALRHIASAQ